MSEFTELLARATREPQDPHFVLGALVGYARLVHTASTWDEVHAAERSLSRVLADVLAPTAVQS